MEPELWANGKNDGVEHATARRIARKRRCDHGIGEKNAVAQPERGSPEYTYNKQADAPSESRFHDRVGDEEGDDNEEHARVGKPSKGLSGIDRASKHRSRYRQQRGRQEWKCSSE